MKINRDYNNIRYGKLLTIKETNPDIYRYKNRDMKLRNYLCRCDCGNEKIIRLSKLRENKVKSCGCIPTRTSLYEEFANNFKVIRQEHRTANSRKRRRYIIHCNTCNKEVFILVENLKTFTGNCFNCHTKKLNYDLNIGNKYCPKCDRYLPISNFDFINNKTRRQSSCKKCRGIHSKFNMNSKQYEELLASQNYVCSICKKEEKHRTIGDKISRLAIDHNHKTGQIRGLLCMNCNRALGLFKEDVEIINNAIKYLKKYEIQNN